MLNTKYLITQDTSRNYSMVANQTACGHAWFVKSVRLVADADKEMQAYSNTIPGSEISYDMVPIPGSKFKMGSPEDEPGRKPDESPQHEVEVGAFWMGKTTVTWNEFELFMYPNEEKKTRETKNVDPAVNALTDATTRPATCR